MKKIQLTQDFSTLVDDEDFEVFNKFKWTYHHAGYAYKSVRRTDHVFLHRLIMNAPKGIEVDHINGNGLDNRKENLRLVTHKQNIANQKKQLNRTSKYKGVSFYKNYEKWEAYICTMGKKYRLGYFKYEKEAALAYSMKAKELFGEFARLNII